ncbi:MAG TPA: trehalase family glycosidase [Acidobacteriaceae bacterium]|jgi:glycogen debranching enzyme|nr:trehalase family glycosidase [Acidobacteriaceae bacterium]
MKFPRFVRYAIVCSFVLGDFAGLAAQSTAFRAPQYQAIRKQLMHGWGTWDSRNILAQVFLPDDVDLNIAFKQTDWISNDYLNTALIGRSDPEAEQVRPGLHALDGSYSEFALKWKTLDVKVMSAVVGGDNGKGAGTDMVMLIEPVHASSLPIEMLVEAGMLWNHPGSVSRQGDFLQATTKSHVFRIYTTGHPIVDPYAQTATPYLAVDLTQPVGISTGRVRSVAEIRAILSRQRARVVSRANSYGNLSETYLAMESVLAWNTIYEPKYDRMVTTVGRIWNRDYGGYCLFGWDNFFLAYMTSLYSRNLAYANFIEHLRSMTDAGFIPNDDRGNGTKSWDHSQPPVGALMLKEIYKRYPEKWLLEVSFPDLLRWNRWWFQQRMNEGLLSYGSNLAKNPYNAPDTHTKITAGYESGMDDSPMYDGVPFNGQKNTLELQDVGLNSLYIADCKALEEIANLLGRKADAAEIAARREKIQTAMASLWNPGVGFYLNRRTDTHAFSSVVSPTMFYPLTARMVDPSRAEEMVHRHLLNPAEFYGQYMIPSVARNNPEFSRQRYWKGAVWPPLNFLVYLGLRNYGLFSVSSDLAQKSNAMFLNGWRTKGIICENYSAITGAGDDPRLSSDRFHSWGALMGIMSMIEAGKMPAPEAPMPQPVASTP